LINDDEGRRERTPDLDVEVDVLNVLAVHDDAGVEENRGLLRRKERRDLTRCATGAR
jgi:hypothetical protein